MKKVLRFKEDGIIFWDPTDEIYKGQYEGVKFIGLGNLKAIVDYLKTITPWNLASARFHILPGGKGWIEVI